MSSLLASALSRMAKREQELAAGDMLFRAGDPVLSLFLVVSGELLLTRALPQGSDLVLQRAGIGAVLAEASLFAESYHCDAIAAGPSVLRVVPRQRIEAALASDWEMTRAWTRHLAQEVQRSRARAEILALKRVTERVAAWIALNDNELPPKGRWRHIASEIGVTPEALYRELARRRFNGEVA